MTLLSLFARAAAPLALLVGTPAIAEAQSAPAAEAAAATKPAPKPVKAKPALWKVSDRDTTIYLFGTVHVLPEGIEWFDKRIAKAFDASDLLVTEIRMDKAGEAELVKLTQSKGLLPPGTTLRSLLTPDQVATYSAAMAKIGFPPEAFDPLKPWLAGLTLGLLPLTQQGYSPESGVEKVLLARAPQKQTGALETAEFQLGIFDGMTREAQIAFLIEAADGVDEVKPTLDRMVAEWAKGDAEALAAVMNDGMSDPAVAEALLYSRNANWAEWIDTRLDTPGTVFIAVGAGHLAGDKSVQVFLRERGIKTKRVK